MIKHFSREIFQLTYEFYSRGLQQFLQQKDPKTGIKHGRIDPSHDQHMPHEENRNSKYCCRRLSAACDFQIVGLESDRLVK